MNDSIMTVREIADFLKVTEKTIYRMVSSGQIPGFKVGGSWRFHREEIIKWMRGKQKQAS